MQSVAVSHRTVMAMLICDSAGLTMSRCTESRFRSEVGGRAVAVITGRYERAQCRIYSY